MLKIKMYIVVLSGIILLPSCSLIKSNDQSNDLLQSQTEFQSSKNELNSAKNRLNKAKSKKTQLEKLLEKTKQDLIDIDIEINNAQSNLDNRTKLHLQYQEMLDNTWNKSQPKPEY